MTQPELNSFSRMAPLIIQKYKRYLPTAFDDSLTMLEKVNKVISYLNELSDDFGDLTEQWNEVMEWIMADGITDDVNAKLDEMVNDGTMDTIINQNIFDDLDTRTTDNTNNVNGLRADVDVLLTREFNIESYSDLVVTQLDTVNDIWDWTDAVTTCLGEMNTGDRLYMPNDRIYGTTSQITIDKTIKLSGNPNFQSFHSGTCVKAIPPLETEVFRYMDLELSVIKDTKNWNDSSIGLHVVNAYHSKFTIHRADGFTTNIYTEGADIGGRQGFSYNSIYLGRIENHRTGMKFFARDQIGWNTELAIYGGSFADGYGIGTDGKHLDFDSDAFGYMNNIRFYNTSFEGHYQILGVGTNCKEIGFYSCRYEMPSMVTSFDWDNKCQSNVVKDGSGLWRVLEYLVDNGYYNIISGGSFQTGRVEYYNGKLFKMVQPNDDFGNTYNSDVLPIGSNGTVNVSPNTGVLDLDLSVGREFYVKGLAEDITAINLLNIPSDSYGIEFSIYFSQDGTGRSITGFPSEIIWGDTVQPTARPSGLDFYTFKFVNNLGTQIIPITHFIRT